MKAPAGVAAAVGPTQGPPQIPVTRSGAPAGGRGGGRGGFGGGFFSGTVASVTPTPEAVTLREHYSLVELPDGNYRAARTTIRAPATAGPASSITAPRSASR